MIFFYTSGFDSSKIIFNNCNLEIFTEVYADGTVNYESVLETSGINEFTNNFLKHFRVKFFIRMFNFTIYHCKCAGEGVPGFSANLLG